MFENSVHLMGRLTADPELKTFGDGAVVCNFTVAINRPVAKGEHPEADFVRCVAWRQTAELLEKYFSKGDRVGIEGRIQVRNYETKESTAVTTSSAPTPPESFMEDDDELPI